MTFRLIVRKECWTLSTTGKLLALASLMVLAAALLYTAYPFLAVNVPMQGDFMVLEGWTADHPGVLRQAASEFEHGHYHKILIIRASYGDDERYSELHASFTDIAQVLEDYGVPRKALIEVEYPAVERDRTYHAALAVKDWFTRNDSAFHSFDVATIGPHARRSLLMYRTVFRNTANIGVIAFTDPVYDPRHWWRTSEGFREVEGEAIAYIYAEFYSLWV